MPGKNMRILAFSTLFAWVSVGGQTGLLAAEDAPADTLTPFVIEPDSSSLEAEQGDYLGLLESGDRSYADCGGCGECEDCDSYGYCEESFCESRSRLFFRADYLLWWRKGARLPPLVTTSADVPPGVLGESTTEILFGNSTVFDGGRSSARLRLGYWLDPCETVAVVAEYYDLGEPTVRFSETSPGDPILVRPFLDVANGVFSFQAVAVPSVAVGDISIEASEYFSSTGVHVRTNLLCYEPYVPADCYPSDDCGSSGGEYCDDTSEYAACNYQNVRLDLIGGYRYYRLTNRLSIGENIVSTAAPNVPGTMFNIAEDFNTENEFNGGELGLLAELNRGPWSLDLQASMMMGNNHRVVRVTGSTASTTPGFATINYQGGLLALPTNIGMYRDDRFVIIPQFSAELGYQLSSCLRAYLGYNFLYWANVARAGDQIDMRVNPTQIPPGTLAGEARPRFEFRSADKLHRRHDGLGQLSRGTPLWTRNRTQFHL